VVALRVYEFDDFFKRHSITHVKIATASPKSNGQIEMINGDLTPMLAKVSSVKNSTQKQILDQFKL
jgi:hypothetical protein